MASNFPTLAAKIECFQCYRKILSKVQYLTKSTSN